MATSSFVIGELDDVRYFDHPDRFNADIMWFTKGYVDVYKRQVHDTQADSAICAQALLL